MTKKSIKRHMRHVAAAAARKVPMKYQPYWMPSDEALDAAEDFVSEALGSSGDDVVGTVLNTIDSKWSDGDLVFFSQEHLDKVFATYVANQVGWRQA